MNWRIGLLGLRLPAYFPLYRPLRSSVVFKSVFDETTFGTGAMDLALFKINGEEFHKPIK